MRFTTLPSIEHNTAYLRPLLATDIDAWAAYLHLPAVYQHTSWNYPSSEELSAYLGNETCGEPDTRLRLAIANRADDSLVGTIGFHSVSSINRVAELAYDLAPGYWGQGIIAVAGQALVAWAHQEVGLLRVQATILDTNLRSQRSIERLGFQREGLLRSYRQVRGTPRDFYIYAHLAAD